MFEIIDTETKLQNCEVALKGKNIIACDLEAEGLDTKVSAIKGIGFGTNQQQFFIPFPHEIPEDILKTFLIQLFSRIIIFHNAKYDMELLLHNKLPIPKVFHDTLLMSWLIDENKKHGLKTLAKELFGREPRKWKELDNEITLLRGEEEITHDLAEYCSVDVGNTYDLFNYFNPLLEKENAKIDYERVELKLVLVLIRMEMRGIKVDVSMLQEKQGVAKEELVKLEKKIIDKIREKNPSSSEFLNLRSPKQLEEILFDILKYSSVKETGSKKRSTDNEALIGIIRKEKLTDSDIVPMILKFRDLDKVYGTYLVALAEQAGVENIIHANFLQHGTKTGRLSSSDPNMQNIPTRHDQWDVRKAFVARKGYKFLMADYNQVELRLLAHFSQDKNMTETFLSGGDIHSKTMELLKIKNRRVAKGINFGIVYGMGSRTLAQIVEIKEDEAKAYIDRFFTAYPMVKPFIIRVQQSAFRFGYVEMLTGRKRHFQEIYDRRWYNLISRQSINSLIQGSAADLIKIAMIRLDPLLKNMGAYILAQIHDELIIETPEDKIDEAKKVITDTMENALKLRIPLKVTIAEGERWEKE